MAEKKLIWTTWEELLLACAVKRHGLRDWDSVARELQNRSSLPVLWTAQVCKTKYHDLKRRFMETSNCGDDADTIPWLEELRKLRVAELQQEVQRYDLSIQSLQLKVKRLEEERERSVKENENGDEKPDLEKGLTEERSETRKNDGAGASEGASAEHAAGEGSDQENRSFNESNSTENREAAVKEEYREPKPVETGKVKPDPTSSDSKPAAEDSCNDSSGRVAKQAAGKPSQDRKGGHPAELRDSADESKEGTKESSDVQSTASLTRKKRREREVPGWSSGCGGDEPVVSPASNKREAAKSEPLVELFDIIRSHKHGSMFEQRLDCQKTKEYTNMVRQHLDLQTIRTRLDKGSYSSCTSKFYRDLLLLFNNAVVFFPKGSPESDAASKLREFVSNEMSKKITQRSDSSPERAPLKPTPLQPKPDPERPESLLAKHKSSVPILVCRKRSSISAKPSNATTNKVPVKQTDEKRTPAPKLPVETLTKVDEERSPTRVKTRERPVTGTRSMRSSKGRANITTPSSNTVSADKAEPPKTDKKKTEATVKKQGAADFLKRIKQNSPLKGMMPSTSKGKETSPSTLKNKESGPGGGGGGGSGRKQQNKRGEERKETTVPKRGGGGGSGGKRVKEENSPSKRNLGRPPKKGRDAAAAGGGGIGTKRGRESGEAEAASKRSKKRPRR